MQLMLELKDVPAELLSKNDAIDICLKLLLIEDTLLDLSGRLENYNQFQQCINESAPS